jgi:hypothetical protein
MKHGLTAKSFLLPLEDPSALEELHAAYLEEFAPQSVAEQDCVEEMVAAVYRQRRLWAMETASLTNYMDMMAPDVARKYKSIPPANRIALAFDSRAAAKCAPDLYLRYDAHLSRAFDRALKRLENIRKLRASDSISPSSGPIPAPNPYSDPKPPEPNEPNPQDQEPRVASSATPPPLPPLLLPLPGLPTRIRAAPLRLQRPTVPTTSPLRGAVPLRRSRPPGRLSSRTPGPQF